jgi:hypothetical protein
VGVRVDAIALEAAARAAAAAREAEKAAAEAAKSAEAAKAEPAPAEPAKPAETQKESPKAAEAKESAEEEAPARAARVAWRPVGRAVMAVAGIVLLAQYVSAYKLMVSFVGPHLILQQYSLVGGLLLLAGGLLRLPPRVRAALAAVAGAVPLFLVGPMLGGFGGWRGLAAAVVFLVMPGALLLRARATDSKIARLLVAFAVGLIALLYFSPVEGVVPVSAAWSLLASGSVSGILTGGIFLAPLGLGVLALTAFAGRDSTGFGTLWACLVLLLGPGAIMAAGMVGDEASLVHVGIAALAAGATAAVGLAQLLDPAPQPA